MVRSFHDITHIFLLHSCIVGIAEQECMNLRNKYHCEGGEGTVIFILVTVFPMVRSFHDINHLLLVIRL
jgi:hypothetical protein